MKTNIYLIRHGRTVWNQEKRLQGHHDIPLHEVGVKQAISLAEHFHSNQQTFKHVYSSDLKRASRTATILAEKLGIPLRLSRELRERDMGDWAGRTIEEIQTDHPDWMEIRDVGGVFNIEKTEELARRMLNQLNHVLSLHMGESIAVVSHGGAINSVLSYISGGELGIGKTVLENTSITHLQYDKEWEPVSMGLTPHLSSL